MRPGGLRLFLPFAFGLGLAVAICAVAPPALAVSGEEAFQALLRRFQPNRLPDGFVSADGRLESEQVEIATKFPGRIAEVLVKEGDLVDQGHILVRMDVSELQAQMQGAQALERRAEQARALAEAVIAQRQSEHRLAEQELQRVEALHAKGFATTELLDQRRSVILVAEAALNAAQASLNDSIAAIDATKADIVRLQSDLDDMQLKAPRRGRIEYKLAQGGEVLGAGSRVLTLIDLTDVYMTVFVPSAVAARLAYNDDARLVLDAIPDYVIPAKVSFVASEAQFTPKTVETREEREKLMFRVKLTLPPDLLKKYENEVKTGVRGVGFLRADPLKAWPDFLAVKLPQ
ncbi:HlyD family efflux transporter periplasmic adaptor subunit [uncultured Rhodoblastus sp.]|uniref:HlyD family secretion protein n=1 Tax=uncultured Rhodoblastus sp. TaxID=543037 RepID=UPI0025D022DF|nr:HlyD family efflux transporter periplasmic adaptor subunit [uncultured Rhodoblastus sp.]